MDDLQNGRGKLTKKNGDVFEGEFKNGLVDGNVVIHYADGRRFKGAYHKGKRQGPCIEEDKTVSVSREPTVTMCVTEDL